MNIDNLQKNILRIQENTDCVDTLCCLMCLKEEWFYNVGDIDLKRTQKSLQCAQN